LNETIAIPVIAENLSENKYVLTQVAFFNKALRPESFHETALFQYISTVLQQQQQHVEYLWRNSDFFAIMGQSALLHIKPKPVSQCAEFVE
jgi:hypothetical protein